MEKEEEKGKEEEEINRKNNRKNKVKDEEIMGVRRKKFRGFPVVEKITKQGVWGVQPPRCCGVIHSQTAFIAIFWCFITQFFDC